MSSTQKVFNLVKESKVLNERFKADLLNLLDDTEGGLVNGLDLCLKYIGVLEAQI